ncbi:MAG: hypothetical protein ACOY4K_07350 [Pseudomonadota bacterium]
MQAFAIAASGLLAATARLDVAAQKIVADPLARPEQDVLALAQARTQLKAQQTVIRTADVMVGRALDLLV